MASSSIGVHPLKGRVLIDIFDTGEETIKLGGKDFILLGDNDLKSHHKTVEAKHPGIRDRWATVLAVSDQAEEDGLQLGDTVLCEKLTWSRKIPHPDGVTKFSMIESKDILFIDLDKRVQEESVAEVS